MARLPIDSFENEIVTLLEFVRVAVKEFPRATDSILSHMDLSDEGFMEDVDVLCAQVDFDFDEPDEEY